MMTLKKGAAKLKEMTPLEVLYLTGYMAEYGGGTAYEYIMRKVREMKGMRRIRFATYLSELFDSYVSKDNTLDMARAYLLARSVTERNTVELKTAKWNERPEPDDEDEAEIVPCVPDEEER